MKRPPISIPLQTQIEYNRHNKKQENSFLNFIFLKIKINMENGNFVVRTFLR